MHAATAAAAAPLAAAAPSPRATLARGAPAPAPAPARARGTRPARAARSATISASAERRDSPDASSGRVAPTASRDRADPADPAPSPPARTTTTTTTRRSLALGAFAAAAASAFALPRPPPAGAAASAATPDSGGNFGDALLERRRTEETAARANLDSIVAEIREEEAKLKALRFEREAESMREINSRRALEESKARQQVADGKTLCITPFGIDVVGITQTVALVGAIGAGLTSNARKAEIAELNEKLRAVNQTLRAQVRPSGPGGAPQVVFPDGGVGGPSSKGGSKGGEGPSSSNEASSDEASANDDPSQTAGASPLDSLDLEDELARAAHAQRVASGESSEESFPAESESQAETKRALRDGRALLKEDAPGAYRRAQEKFELALTMARMLGDRVQMRRATRGISASRRGLGDGKGAIEGLKRVLEISKEIGDYTGDTDALGAIADIYTEIGDLENAGKYYDLYLDALNDEMNVN